MTQTASKISARTEPDRPRPEQSREAPAFKPVALPAVAAAVQCSRLKPQDSRAKDLPQILRDEPDSD
jgi:hypothetical protein